VLSLSALPLVYPFSLLILASKQRESLQDSQSLPFRGFILNECREREGKRPREKERPRERETYRETARAHFPERFSLSLSLPLSLSLV